MAEILNDSIARKRSFNYTTDETNLLVKLVNDNNAILSGAFSNTITAKRKREIWEEICSKVNAIGVARRTVDEIKKKWKNIKGEAKKKFVKQNNLISKTGGGPPPSELDHATRT
ncbi:nuclear apoptosis-inducing factor 1-like [Tubulanus polymorphus]|uniref:nuclear apoptosis-inducing factor 1-like n=1 Tax=Tubulanus polymorphus TaxID=672921 RepID=UPI003DA2CB27